LETFWEELEKGPPPSHVRFRLLEGDREMGERFLSALREAAPMAVSLEELRQTYGEALWPEEEWRLKYSDRGVSAVEEGEPPCQWLREHLGEPGAEDPLFRALIWSKLALCPGPEVDALFARYNAPLPLVLEHYHRHGLPRLTVAMRNGVRRLLTDDRQYLFPLAAALLLQSEDPAAQGLFEELARQARGKVREQVHEKKRDQQRSEEYHQRKCQFIPVTPEEADALRIDTCLHRWAQADWQATARLASMLVDQPDTTDAQRHGFITLTRFTSMQERDAWARERGLLPFQAQPSTGRDTLQLQFQMLGAQRALAFFPNRVLGEGFPVRHDELLVTLAWMARPELQGLVFEEVPPPWDEARLEGVGDYTLRAYADGERFSVTARNLGEWRDVGAVLALLNAVLAARGSSTRFAATQSLSPVMDVVFGPEPGLKEAHAAGLMRLGDASQIVLEVREEAQKSLMQLMGRSP
jgi:hypothetical protein